MLSKPPLLPHTAVLNGQYQAEWNITQKSIENYLPFLHCTSIFQENMYVKKIFKYNHQIFYFLLFYICFYITRYHM